MDPRTHPAPWTFADTALWVPQPPIDMILLAAHGSTLSGGNGPAPNQGTHWLDYDPRYAQGGAEPRYDTPPPRSESMIVKELIPYVEAYLPAIPGRKGWALAGISDGGIGTGIIGLHHPDHFLGLYQMSGIGFPWAHPCQVDTTDVNIFPPTDPPFYLESPGIQPLLDAFVPIATGYGGDGATLDHVYARWNNPADIVRNGRALRNGRPVLSFEFYANDAIPQRTEELLDPLTPVLMGLEILVATSSGPLQEDEANRYGVPHRYTLRKGIHSAVYWIPFFRSEFESMYASVQHWDGTGNVFPDPDDFDYRTIAEEFSIWGWEVSVDRVPQEFLDLTDVTCNGITLRGSGVVRVTVPQECGTGVNGSRVLSVDLGPSRPTNEPYGASECDFVGNQIAVVLEDLDGDGLTGAGDNCPRIPNPGQEDQGGVDTVTPDGIGDACQCGEVTGNGVVDGQDGFFITRHGLG